MRTDLAWAAGFFDGEGTAFVSYATWKGVKGIYRYPALELGVCQSGEYGEELLLRFQASVGGFGKVTGPMHFKNKKWQPRWDWHCRTLVECQKVYAQLWPYLGPYKRKQIYDSAKVYLEHLRNPPVTHPRGSAGRQTKTASGRLRLRIFKNKVKG